MTIETLIKKSLKECILEAIRSQRKAIKEGQAFVPYEPTTSEEDKPLKDKPEKERIRIGKEYEKGILGVLSKYGTIQPSSDQEDIRYKLDGFITFPEDSEFSEYKGRRVSIQIKKRVQTGNDILFEVERDFNSGTIGRDQKGTSELYAVSDQSGRIGIFKTAYLKRIVEAMLNKDPERLEAFRNNDPSLLGAYETSSGELKGVVYSLKKGDKGAELRVTEGNPEFSEGSRKLLAFINFDAGKPIFVINM